MNNLIIYTKEPFTQDKGAKQLKEYFKNYEVSNDSDTQLFMGKYPNSFSLQLNSTENRHNSTELKEDIEESLKYIPNKDSIFTEFLYNKVLVARRVINVLLSIYPDLWVEDCDFEWIGSGADYIKSHHMDDQLGYKTPDI